MARRITVNVGFITNSSSCVYYFPKEVLQDPQIKAFIEAHDLADGYVGHDLWSRSGCSSLLVTAAQKAEAKQILRHYSWDGEDIPEESVQTASAVINPGDDGVYVIYGDEYSDTTHILCRLMSNALAAINKKNPEEYHRSGYLTDFN